MSGFNGCELLLAVMNGPFSCVTGCGVQTDSQPCMAKKKAPSIKSTVWTCKESAIGLPNQVKTALSSFGGADGTTTLLGRRIGIIPDFEEGFDIS